MLLRKCVLFVFVALPFATPALSGPLDEMGVMQNAVSPLTTPTYDGSGQVTEPAIVHFPSGWHGFKYWLTLAPYPRSNAADENPSILVSDDGIHWSVPPGVSNPLERPMPGAHLADPSLFYDRISDQLWLYYVEEEARHYTNLLRIVSADGIHWSTPELQLRTPDYQLVMPAVAKRGAQYWLWTVNAGRAGCSASSTEMQYRTSWDGVHWSVPHLVDIVQPGYKIWHISVSVLRVRHPLLPDPSDGWSTETDLPAPTAGMDSLSNDPRVPSPPSFQDVFVMLASAFDKTCGPDSLFLAYSTDGIHWIHFARPLLTPKADAWDDIGIYQSTLALDPTTNLMKVWYSAIGDTGWRLGLTQEDFTKVLRILMARHTD